MPSWRLAGLIFALGLTVAPTVNATIVLLGQDRRAASSVFVTGETEFDSDQLTEVAPDTGPFDVTLLTEVVITDASASATAIQSSTIGSEFIEGSGLATGDATAEGNAIAYAAANSNVAIRFSVEQPRSYSILGFLEGTENSTATFQLSRPFETLAWFRADEGYLPVEQHGTMEPGTYDLNITCGGGATADPSGVQRDSAAYDILFLLSPVTDVPSPTLVSVPMQAAPNPFRASTRISIPEGVREVRVMDARGRLVRTLAASPSVPFDGRDEAGRPLAGGVYWLKAVGGPDIGPVKVVRLR
jgi:hypothetical protein